MATRLIQIVTFVNVPPAGSVPLPHNLNINGTPVRPDYLALDMPGFTASATATTVTVVNNTVDAATVNVWLEHKHTMPRQLGALPNLSPQPFVAAAGGGGGGLSVFDDFIQNGTYFDDFINDSGYVWSASNPLGVRLLQTPSNNGYALGVLAALADAPGDQAEWYIQYDKVISPSTGQATISLGSGPLVWQVRGSLGSLLNPLDNVWIGGPNGFGFAVGPDLWSTSNWVGYGVNGEPVDLGVLQDTEIRTFRFELDLDDTARWYIDGVLRATDAPSGLGGNTMRFGTKIENAESAGGLAFFADYFAMTYRTGRV